MVLLTIAQETGDTLNLDVDLGMELENLQALLEADSGVPVNDQMLFFSGRQLTNPKDTLAVRVIQLLPHEHRLTLPLQSYGVNANDMLLLRQKSNDPGTSAVAGGRCVSPSLL